MKFIDKERCNHCASVFPKMTTHNRPKKVDQIVLDTSQSRKHRVIFEHVFNPRDFISVTSTASTRLFKPFGWVTILGGLFFLLSYDSDDSSYKNNTNAKNDLFSLGRLGSRGRNHYWEENSPINVMHGGAKESSMLQDIQVPASIASAVMPQKPHFTAAVENEDPAKRKLHHHKHPKAVKPIDYSIHSCDEMNDLQYKYPNRNIDRCELAKNCNDGDGVLFPSLFCGDGATDMSQGIIAKIPNALLLIILSLSLLLLFHLLNSTTDEFFSPGLELFSIHLGLPPRFAAVTLLALGNGAPDVAATVNAILEDPAKGYQMAVGELTGTAMFVSGVILGVIVSLSGDVEVKDSDRKNRGKGSDDENGENGSVEDEKKAIVGGADHEKRDQSISANTDCCNNDQVKTVQGVACRGALLRDIAVLIIVLLVTMSYFERGVVDSGLVHSLLGIYISYVLLVLGADSYHLFYHLPNLLKDIGGKRSNDDRSECLECCAKSQNSDVAHALEVVANGDATESTPLMVLAPQRDDSNNLHDHYHQSHPIHSHTLGDSVIEAMSNYNCDEEQLRDHYNHNRNHSLGRHQSKSNGINKNSESMGESKDSTARISVPASASRSLRTNRTGWALPSEDGTEPIVIFHPRHAVHPHHGGGPAFIHRDSSLENASNTRHSGSRVVKVCHSWSHGDRQSSAENDTNGSPPEEIKEQPFSSDKGAYQNTTSIYSALMINNEHITNTQYPEGLAAISFEGECDSNNTPRSWRDALTRNHREWIDHWKDFFLDIYQNDENSVFDVIVLTVELPFTIARKLTNPVPCDGYYCRPLVAMSIALSPIWIRFYFLEQFDLDIFSSHVGYLATFLTSLISIFVARYAPNGDGPMEFYMIVPITLYGFAISATWLDSIADKLVQLLELFGVLLRVPKTIMGLTVLAFGNSIQDLIANISVSKKGLSTMAVTACFAGPIFNFGVGLGLGFWALMKTTGSDEIPVEFPNDLRTGFYFTIANCLMIVFAGTVVGKGVIGKKFGYVACALYVVYVFTSLYVSNASK
mmetsp:Transcript_3617/g.8131  ORF Transcript_3617/g.8131 Transcript_3617/m.8131 type:complete len:1036 (+) Transcript_3617:136-3243(+)